MHAHKPGMAAGIHNPNVKETETEGSLGLGGWPV